MSIPVMVSLGATAGAFFSVMKDAEAAMLGLAEKGKLTDASMKKVADGMVLGMGAAAVVVGEKSLQAAANFETATTRLVTTGGVAEDQIGKIRQGILDMSGQIGVSADDMASAMYYVTSAGFNTASDGLQVLKAAMQGAVTEGSDVSMTADALTTLMKDFGDQSDKAAQDMSRMNETVAHGKMTLQDLASSMSTVAPAAHLVHDSMSDMLASMATMTSEGIHANEAADELAHTYEKALNPTEQMTQALNQIGWSATDLQTKIGQEGLIGTLNEMTDAIANKMGKSGKIVLDLFNSSRDAANNLNLALQNSTGKLHDLEQGLANNTVTLGDFRTQVKALPDDQAKMATAFADLYDKANGFTNALKEGKPEAVTFAQMLQAMTGDQNTLNTAMALTGTNADAANQALKDISGTMADADGNVSGFSKEQDTYNGKMKDFKSALHSLSIEMGDSLLPAATKLTGGLADVVGALDKTRVGADALNTILVVLAASALANLVVKLAASAGALKTLATAIWSDVIPAVWGAITAVSQWAFSLAVVYGEAAINGLKALGTTITESVIPSIAAGAVAAANWAKSMALLTAETLFNGLKSLGSIIKTAVVPALMEAASAAWAWTAAMLANPITWIIILLALLVVWIILLVKHFDKLKDSVNGMGGAMTYVAGAVLSVIPGLQQLGYFLMWAGDHFDELKQKGKAAFEALVTAAETIIPRIVTAIGEMLGEAISTIEGWVGSFTSAGYNLIMGLISGIESAVGAAISVVSGAMSSIYHAALGALGIHSPSLLFKMGVGVPIMQGVAAGITESKDMVSGSLNAALDPSGMRLNLAGAGSAIGPLTGRGAGGTTEVHFHLEVKAPIIGTGLQQAAEEIWQQFLRMQARGTLGFSGGITIGA